MNPLLALVLLGPAIKIIYRHGREFSEQDFQELTEEQYEAYRRKVGSTDQRVYRMVLAEPTVIERTPEKVTFELEIVSEQEKLSLLEAVRYIRFSSQELDSRVPTFDDRLEYLRVRWPEAVTGVPRDK